LMRESALLVAIGACQKQPVMLSTGLKKGVALSSVLTYDACSSGLNCASTQPITWS
jgi:hypothetical protein